MKIQILIERVAILLFALLLSSACAAELTFSPQNPQVEIGGKITLSVSGTSGAVIWSASKGQISGTGTQVTYWAPEQVGTDVVTVLDKAGNTKSLKIIMPRDTGTPSQENAVWEVLMDRSHAHAIVMSEDEQTLWVGTTGGLEQRDGATGELVRVFTTADGLPDNYIQAFYSDSSGGLWIGTEGGLAYRSFGGDWTVYNTDNVWLPSNDIWTLYGESNGGLWIGTWSDGLAHRNSEGGWKVYNTDNTGLPDNDIRAIYGDYSGGLWIGTWGGGLAYRNSEGHWRVYNTNNAGLPDNHVRAIYGDSSGGLWIGTSDGLAYRNSSGDWTVYNTDNAELPDNSIWSLYGDSSGGLWIGTSDGLAYRNSSGDWTIYNTDNTGLPNNWVNVLYGDSNGGLWISGGGLAYRSVGGEWTVYNIYNAVLPSNYVNGLYGESSGGLWIGTCCGLAYRSVGGDWTVYNTDNAGLPGNWINTLYGDSSGGLWIGTSDGLAYRSSDGDWTVYNTDNTELPDNNISAIYGESSGGLWIGTWGGGLAYRSVDGDWTVYNTDNAELPSNDIYALYGDSSGGLWIGTWGGGLAYRSVGGDWTVYNSYNAGLLDNDVTGLYGDSSGGLWIGTWGGGLAYRNSEGEWTVYNTNNAGLPSDSIELLYGDSSGGLWIGTWGGLAYRSSDGDWTVYNVDNAGLQYNYVTGLYGNSIGGLWIGTYGGGLVHLTFSQKNALCPDLSDEQCQNLLTGKRAAIIIAGGGADKSNTLWDSTASISESIYKMLQARGFDNDEIYYLSPRSYADFNGDDMDDCIVDAPATPKCRLKAVDNPISERPLIVDDVRQAFAWAKTGGQLDQPLYVFFINHGDTDRFQLSKDGYLGVLEFKTILDDYQQVTGSEVALVIDTCHSGALLQKLISPNRAIISSTGDDLAYFDRTHKLGFSRFFANGLLQGQSFWDAFEFASEKQNQYVMSFSFGQDMVPQWYDGSDDGQWLRDIFINGDFAVADLGLTVEAITASTSLEVGQSLLMKAKVSLEQGRIKGVWAIVKPPKVNLVLDRNGTPILPFPHLDLARSTQDEDVWATIWQDFVYNGVYEITFYAEDEQGNISGSDPITVEVRGGVEAPESSSVQIELAKERYQRGEPFQALLTEELGWGYDLYAAILLPDGHFFALIETNKVAGVDKAIKWFGQRKPHTPVRLFDLTLPENLPTGRYCLYGILSPERELVLETVPLWVWTEQCFEVF